MITFFYKTGSSRSRGNYSYFAPFRIIVKKGDYIIYRQQLPKRIDGRFMANLPREQRKEALFDLLFLASNREENVRQLARDITKKFRQQNHSNRSKMDII